MKTDTPETEKAWIPEKGETNILWHKRQHATSKKLERERNQARQERDELKCLLEIALEYMRESLAFHDANYARHPSTEVDRKIITEDLEKVESALEKLKEPKTNNVLETP